MRKLEEAALEAADAANATTVAFWAELGAGSSMTAEYGLELHLTFVDELTASVDDGTFQAALISAGNLSVLGTTVLAVNETKVAIAEDTSVIFSWDGDPSDLAAALADDGGGGGGGSKDDDGADNAGFDFMYVIIGLIALLVLLCCILLVVLFRRAEKEEKEKAEHMPAPVVVDEPRRRPRPEEEFKEGSVDALVVGFLNSDWESQEALSSGDV